MTQPEETDTHEIKPASHCLNLKPNLSLTAQTETTERKRGGESDTSVRGCGEGAGVGSEKSEGKEGEGERESTFQTGLGRGSLEFWRRLQVHRVALLPLVPQSFSWG